jgi:hypothetical protein
MARYDKYDPIGGGNFRADIAADFPDANLGKLYGVGLDTTGKVVIGAGNTGIIGVMVITQKPGRVGPLREVQRVDVMRTGEITDFGPTAGVPGTDFGTAATKYYSDSSGNITATATSNTYVGFTIEPDRLVVSI